MTDAQTKRVYIGAFSYAEIAPKKDTGRALFINSLTNEIPAEAAFRVFKDETSQVKKSPVDSLTR